ncbi:MAG: bifunctional hydroxymethylpyrimidine kinase/phosphomethylpyrimidine kinase [Eubacteriaceae bacterium]
MKKVLTIAGSDCSGGAGIQADIKTMTAHKCYGMSVITALTAQNTIGVYDVRECEEEFVKKQMDCVFGDIFPDAIKIGMVSSSNIINAISDKLIEYKGNNIVVDPVMISTSGSKLLNENAINILKNKLIPLASVITPNVLEAQVLCGFEIANKSHMVKAARKISEFYNGNILIKGGHLKETADDLLFYNEELHWFSGERINNPNTHGTGCTLSSAIACNLAMGLNITKSIENSKKYITGALKSGLDLGCGNGPLNHCYNIP